MSINDFFNDSSVPLIMGILFVVIMIIALPIGIANGKKTTNAIYGDDSDQDHPQEKKAKVLAKRTSPHPLNQTIMINMVVFEFENGTRLELALKDQNEYGLLVEGDEGTLRYQGKKYISFNRGVVNED